MLARSPRLDTANDVGTPCERLLSVSGSLLAGEALEDDAGVGANFEIGDCSAIILVSNRRRETR